MRTLVVTVVTMGEAWEALDPDIQQELLRWLQRLDPESKEYDRARRLVQQGTGLSPATGCVVGIGIWDPGRESGVLYTTIPDTMDVTLPTGWQVRSGDEAAMLSWFWSGVSGYQVVVSFAGHSFALPFLAHRAIRYEITPARGLLGPKRITEQQSPYHVDLQEELTFYKAMQKRPSLALWCHAYDIPRGALQAASSDIERWCTEHDLPALTQHMIAKIEATHTLYRRWCAHLAPAGWVTGDFS